MFLLFADVSSTPWPLAVVIAVGFLIGAYGHAAKSRTLIITGIIIIAVVSAYFVALSQAGHPF